jgi:hypothetical protein
MSATGQYNTRMTLNANIANNSINDAAQNGKL